MKKLIVLILLLFSFSVYSQTTVEKIEKCIKKGDSRGLYKYFCATIDLEVPNFYELATKTQAEQIIRDFFEKNKPTFFVTDKVETKQDVTFIIGQYVSKTRYIVYIVINKDDLITTISFIEKK